MLPPDTAATVYIQLSPAKPFVLLGAIGNDKPSAIFRVRGLDGAIVSSVPMGDVDAMSDETAPTSIVGGGDGLGRNGGGVGVPTVVILGISIEPLNIVQAALASIPPAVSATATPRSETPSLGGAALVLAGSKPSTLVVAQRIIKNAFNYLSSFAIKVQLPGQGIQDVIPLKSFQDWWVKFEKKVELNPGFLEKEESD